MDETTIRLKKIGNGWVVTVSPLNRSSPSLKEYDIRLGLTTPMYFPTLEATFEYLQKHLGKI